LHTPENHFSMSIPRHTVTVAALVVLAIAAALIAAFLFSPGAVPAREPVSLAIMTTSDLQSQVMPDADGNGGLARIATARNLTAASVDGALLLSSGDDLMGPLYAMFHGEPELRAMTAAGYDAVCPGNHEFDLGTPVYAEGLERANVTVVCANLETDDPVLAAHVVPRTIRETAGVRIGIFGLITPDLPLISAPGNTTTVNGSLLAIAQQEADLLRADGADLVVAVTHLGSAIDRKIAEGTDGIDLIVGGHDHIYVNETVVKDGRTTWIVQDGMRGGQLGVLRFVWRGGGIEDAQWETVPVDNRTAADPEVAGLLGPFLTEYDRRLADPVGSIASPLDLRTASLRTGEAAAGDLVADAWREWFPHADMALVNGGDIRGDAVIPAGPVSTRTVNEMLPFDNTIVSMQLNGSMVRQALEVSAAALDPETSGIESGAFLQVSGIRVEYDRSAPPYRATYDGRAVTAILDPGARVAMVEVGTADTGWVPLENETVYTVLANSYLASGGNGYWMFAAAGGDDTTVYEADPVTRFLRSHSPATADVDGRIAFSGASG
jgi:5'-nucleotidase/UDP-sugar diphosphatase